MRPELLAQLLSPVPTVRTVTDVIRRVIGGEQGEGLVGQVYGDQFRRREAVYDASGGRWTRETEWIRKSILGA
jgi:hypothetical protein